MITETIDKYLCEAKVNTEWYDIEQVFSKQSTKYKTGLTKQQAKREYDTAMKVPKDKWPNGMVRYRIVKTVRQEVEL